MKFIFTCASGDISFCGDEDLEKIVERIRSEKDKIFLLQSKDPATFNRKKFPSNVILATTLETNRDRGYDRISKAPVPTQRYEDFLAVDHPHKIVTMEPMLDFDIDEMAEWIEIISPLLVFMDILPDYSIFSLNSFEPPLEKILELASELTGRGYVVKFKENLQAQIGKLDIPISSIMSSLYQEDIGYDSPFI